MPATVNCLLAGEIRIIARANGSPQVRNETTRVNAVNVNVLASHRGAVLGFLKAYKKSVDRAYSSWNANRAPAGLALSMRNAVSTRFPTSDASFRP